MPFTPFHFGPAAAFKAAMRSRFSFTIFCYSQVVTDLESGFYLLRGEYPVHRLFHTFIGATLLGLVCALTGRPIFQALLQVFERVASISWRIAFISAFLGTYSHVLLDSIMHRDVAPFVPFTTENPLFALISLRALHLLCLALGVGGVLIYLVTGKHGTKA